MINEHWVYPQVGRAGMVQKPRPISTPIRADAPPLPCTFFIEIKIERVVRCLFDQLRHLPTLDEFTRIHSQYLAAGDENGGSDAPATKVVGCLEELKRDVAPVLGDAIGTIVLGAATAIGAFADGTAWLAFERVKVLRNNNKHEVARLDRK